VLYGHACRIKRKRKEELVPDEGHALAEVFEFSLFFFGLLLTHYGLAFFVTSSPITLWEEHFKQFAALSHCVSCPSVFSFIISVKYKAELDLFLK